MQTQPSSENKPLRVNIDATSSVSALLRVPKLARACYLFAHGAGAGMAHSFMEEVADGLAERQVATMRYQFPYAERGSKRPDTPAVAHGAVRAACAAALQATGLPLFAGGKSFGGRMTSQAQAFQPLLNVRGLVFLGFPLHSSEKPSSDRANHLSGVRIPMLFIQGTRDKLAEHDRMRQLVDHLDHESRLLTIQHADHGFDVLVRSGRKHGEVMAELLNGLAGWVNEVLTVPPLKAAAPRAE